MRSRGWNGEEELIQGKKTAKMKQSSNAVQSTGACMKQCEEH